MLQEKNLQFCLFKSLFYRTIFIPNLHWDPSLSKCLCTFGTEYCGIVAQLFVFF